MKSLWFLIRTALFVVAGDGLSLTQKNLRGDWPVKFWSQNVPEQVFVFFQVWVPKHAYFHLSQYFYDICLIFMQMKTFFEP